ncbi:hypothetical protein MVEN_00107000 [Mycena venus]|uniref:Uncharacterized protein n=1 Tax=Mycena venus TaxID=2733690 RepID=A0A8H6ZB52_9AGAR|nr:hypothetical protein MVEN_00107000 [Mycena venus]
MDLVEPPKATPSRFGFYLSPLSPPHVPDVLICSVDPCFQTVSLVGALNSEVNPVSARKISRWLFLLARGSSSVRPICPPAVYRSITFVGADIFVRAAAPGCYALFVEDEPYPYPFGQTIPASSFAETERTWDVPHDDFRAAYRMANPIPDNIASNARERDRGVCCFTGRPSDFVSWVIPPLLCYAVPPPVFSLEQCLCVDNVFTISLDLLQAYQENRIAVDPQDGYRLVVFGEFSGATLLTRLGSAPTSGRFWHASLSWTLAVRFAGCDLGLRIRAKASDLLEELNSDGAHMIPQGSKWSTPAGQEAIRVFFWARAGCPLPPRRGERWDTTPPSPSSSTSCSHEEVNLPNREEAHIVPRHFVPRRITPWLLFFTSGLLLLLCFGRICRAIQHTV